MDHGLGVRCEHGFNGPCKLRNAGALRHGSFRGSPTLRTTPNLCMRIAEIGNHRHGSGQGEHPHAARAVRQTGRAVGILAGGRRLELPVLQFARGPGQLGFPMSMEANSPRENAVPSNCFRTDRGRRDRSSETSVRPDQSYPQVRKLIVQFPGLPVKFERLLRSTNKLRGRPRLLCRKGALEGIGDNSTITVQTWKWLRVLISHSRFQQGMIHTGAPQPNCPWSRTGSKADSDIWLCAAGALARESREALRA